MNLKKAILPMLAFALTFVAGETIAQTPHAANATTQATDSALLTTDDDSAGIVAYSDTTSSMPATASTDSDDWDEDAAMHELFDEMKFMTSPILFILLIIFFCIFVVLPIIVLILVVWLIVQNRKNRLKLAEKAMETGQPIPQETMPARRDDDEDLRIRGLRYFFLGIGLLACGHFIIGDVLQGCGVLLMCFGLGQIVIARVSSKKKDNNKDDFYEITRDEE